MIVNKLLYRISLNKARSWSMVFNYNIITDCVVLWKIQKFDRLIPETKWHSCLHNRALCSYLATMRLLHQRENNLRMISVLKSVPFLHECHFRSAWMSFWPAMPELLPGETRIHSSRVEPEKTIDSKSIKTFHCLTERWYVAIIACCDVPRPCSLQ